MHNKLIKYELNLLNKGIRYIAGVDEVGRGALAGPFVVGAVILDLEKIFTEYRNNDVEHLKLENIKDSKQLTQKNREIASEFIYKICISTSIEVISSKVVDKIGISKCTQMGFFNAIKKLKVKPQHILTDAFAIKGLSAEIQTNIRSGDKLSISIAAASIIAKVFRDNLMRELHKEYEEYGFDRHKGYGTKLHIENLRKFGHCEIHRMSFSPIKQKPGVIHQR